MAFAGLLRTMACRGSVFPFHAASNSARFCAGPVTITRGSSLLSTVSRSHIKQSMVSWKLRSVQFCRSIQVNPFSTSPKSFSAAKHNHTHLWTLERVLSAALLVVVPAALLSPNKVFDTIAAVSLVMHSHWGIEAIIVDYVRPLLFGNIAPKVAIALLYGLSIITLAGLFQLIYSDIGFANTIKKIWKM